MKKLLSIVVIASFVLGLIAFAPFITQASIATATEGNNGIKANAGEDLEKILSPDDIRYFKNIVKKGNVMYGIRKDKMIEKKEALASSTNDNLEKIPAPHYISLYERIKKVGNTLWGYKKAVPEKKANRRLVTTEMSSCVITAVETKDASIVAKNSAFTTGLNAAIAVRTACQKTALGSTENQFANLDACVKTFKNAFQTLKDQNKKDHNAIWKTYRESLAVCAKNTSTNASSTPAEGALTIEDGGGSITD